MLDHVLTTTAYIPRQSSLIIPRQGEQRIRRGTVLACFDLWVTNGRFVFILRRLDLIEKNRVDKLHALTLFIPRFLFVMVNLEKCGHKNRLKRDLG
jgi:hypothetical protein